MGHDQGRDARRWPRLPQRARRHAAHDPRGHDRRRRRSDRHLHADEQRHAAPRRRGHGRRRSRGALGRLPLGLGRLERELADPQRRRDRARRRPRVLRGRRHRRGARPGPVRRATTALVTLERGTIHSTEIERFDSNSGVLRIPIEDEHVPNIFVGVVLYRPPTGEDPVPRYNVGYVELPVSTETRVLDVRVEPDREQAQPGETVTYEIEVTDSEGDGVHAEVSLAVVDKALLSLQEEINPDGLRAFWFQRGLAVETASSLAVSVDSHERRDLGRRVGRQGWRPRVRAPAPGLPQHRPLGGADRDRRRGPRQRRADAARQPHDVACAGARDQRGRDGRRGRVRAARDLAAARAARTAALPACRRRGDAAGPRPQRRRGRHARRRDPRGRGRRGRRRGHADAHDRRGDFRGLLVAGPRDGGRHRLADDSLGGGGRRRHPDLRCRAGELPGAARRDAGEHRDRRHRHHGTTRRGRLPARLRPARRRQPRGERAGLAGRPCSTTSSGRSHAAGRARARRRLRAA